MSARKPIRVVHLCAVDFTVRQFIAPVALALRRAGYDVRCACTKGPHWEELRGMGVRMVEMPIARSANPLRALISVIRLALWLQRDRPDILHVHTPVASFIGRLAARLAGVPLVVYTAHGFYFHDRMPSLQQWIHTEIERLFARLTDVILCVSAEDAALAREKRFLRKSRIIFIPNGVDTAVFDPARTGSDAREKRRDEFGIPRDARVVAIMGRLVREKGFREFFRAAQTIAARHSDVHFLVVGDTVTSEHDDAKAGILRLAETAVPGGRVHFTGLRRDVAELLAASDIFCLPTYREGMPVSVIEAMMMSLPVVTTRIRGCREVVIDGETGILVEPRDCDALESALTFMLDSGEVAGRMGAAGRRRALRHFNSRRTLARQIRIYDLLAARLGK